MSDRQRLPNRRASETFALECAGLKYTATVSRFADGRIGCRTLRTNFSLKPSTDLAGRQSRSSFVATERERIDAPQARAIATGLFVGASTCAWS
jgi:hypothetical protein